MKINPISELFNSFEEIHYFTAGLSLGFLLGFAVCIGFLKNIHKSFFKKSDDKKMNILSNVVNKNNR